MPANGRHQGDGVWLDVKPLNGSVISLLVPSASRVNKRRRRCGGSHMKEQRLRRGLLCTRLTSGNEFPHTMIGGSSGAACLAEAAGMRGGGESQVG
jgi:hypothetical protein